ncbi:MAG: SMP-30/gluconolactonase/LRE family protein [bacterium]|nr:SMP-30/gluconolactonase/LRE family protein [bacterium]
MICLTMEEKMKLKLLSILLLFSCGAMGVRAQDTLDSLVAGEVVKLRGGFQFIEGPVWHQDGVMLFSDINASRIYAWNGTSADVWRANSFKSNGLGIDTHGRLIACEHGAGRVSMTEKDGSIVTITNSYDGKRLNSPNDVIVRSDGTVFFTDPDWGLEGRSRELGFNGVYRVKPGGETVLLDKDYAKPNGIGLSPDEQTLYVADDTRNIIRVYDLDAEGNVSNPRTLANVSNPDGFAVDVDGRIWSSSSTGITVVAPTGERIGIIRVAEQPANCAFGDEDMKSLYITARTGLYKIRLNVEGLNPWSKVTSSVNN